MSSTSFATLATVTASTKRATMSGSKRGSPTTNLASISILPLMPVGDGDIREQLGTSAPFELLQTAVDGDADIREGDILVVDSVEYDVRGVGDWPWTGGGDYKAVFVEQRKQ